MTHGVDDATRAAIGELPRGRGILGVLIDGRTSAAPGRHQPRPAFGRIPAESSADGQLSRRPGDDARRCVREPVPGGEAACRRLHRRGRGDRHAPRRPGGGCDRERRQRAARRAAARGAGAGGRAAPARARAARRDGAGADVDPARPRPRSSARTTAEAARRAAARAARRSSSRRCRTCGGSPSSCARRLWTTSGSSRRSAGSVRRVREARRLDVQVEATARCAPAPGGCRDGALPHRAGGAHERGQACRRRACQHRRDAQAGQRVGGDRGRRPRLRCTRPSAGGGSACSGCASGSSCSTGRSRSRRAPGGNDPDRRAAGRQASSAGRVARERGERASEGRRELEAVARAGGGDDDPAVPFEHEGLVGRARVEARLGGDRLGIELRVASCRPGRDPAHDRRIGIAGLVGVGRRAGMMQAGLEADRPAPRARS